jgi:hypothetical protein
MSYTVIPLVVQRRLGPRSVLPTPGPVTYVRIAADEAAPSAGT